MPTNASPDRITARSSACWSLGVGSPDKGVTVDRCGPGARAGPRPKCLPPSAPGVQPSTRTEQGLKPPSRDSMNRTPTSRSSSTPHACPTYEWLTPAPPCTKQVTAVASTRGSQA